MGPVGGGRWRGLGGEGDQQFGVKRGYLPLELCGNPWYTGQACLTKMKLQRHSCELHPTFFQKF